jgi:hypothetical protein
MCSRGKHFIWVNLDQYYRCYGKNTDVSTKIPVKFMSSRHIFHIFGSYCAFNVRIGFPSRPYACPPCVCVTGSTDTLAYGKCRSESVISKKIPVFLMTILLGYYNQTKEENFLKKKWECIKNTNSPRLIRRYRIESKSKFKKKLFRTLKTLSNLTQKNYLPAN